jgi:hypothetical protein
MQDLKEYEGEKTLVMTFFSLNMVQQFMMY